MTAAQVLAFVTKCQQSKPTETVALCHELLEALYHERKSMLEQCSSRFRSILEQESSHAPS